MIVMTLRGWEMEGHRVTSHILNFPARGQAAVLSLAVTKHLARGCLLADVTTSMCKHAGDNEKIEIKMSHSL